MKKRLLITSIVMMLVCAVALSTATYAWFTSNTTVSASTMTLKAATSDKSALGIGWTGKTAGTFIVSNINAILDPMAPDIFNDGVRGPLTDGTTTYETDSTHNQQFYTSNIKQEGSFIEFSNKEYKVNPVVYTELAADATKDTMTSGKSNSFYVVNMSTANVLDTVVVSGVFTDWVNNERYIMVDTSVAPTQGVDYYLKNGNDYEIIANVGEDPEKQYRTDLQTHGFDNEKTYYIRQSLYVETSDTVVKEDTQYYTRSGSEGNYTYAPADVAVGSSATGLFEKRNQNGDDMLRIAIFTKEYRIADADQYDGDNTYYWIHPTSGILTEFENATADDVANYKLLEAKTEKHTLRGVLGKYATTFTAVPAGTKLDMNTIYYELKSGDNGKEQIKVSAGTFADLKDAGLFTKSGDTYSPLANDATYDSSVTYYKNKYTIVASPEQASATSYYTASNTVVNGQISINKKVKDMYYYTNVNKSLDLSADLEALRPGELIDIVAVIWLDGTVLDDTRSDEYAQVSLKFDSVRNTHSSQNLH